MTTKKTNGKYVIPAFVSVVILITVFLGLHNVSANSKLKDRVMDNEAVRREIDAEHRGDLKAIKETVVRIEKKIDKLSERK